MVWEQARSGEGQIGRQELLRRPSTGVVPILIRYHVSLHGSRATSAIVTYLLAGVRTVRGRPVFTTNAGVTLHVSQTHTCSRRSAAVDDAGCKAV